MSSPNPKSGPYPPHGGAEVTVKSGPYPPHGAPPPPPPPESGKYPPHGGSAPAPNPTASGGAAAALQAAEPEPATRAEAVGIRFAIHKPEPFSVFITSSDRGDVQIQSIKIEIQNRERPVFTEVVEKELPLVLNNPSESHVFPFSNEQLDRVLPHLQVGNYVKVRVDYRAAEESELTIGIIEREHHHKLGRFIEHLFR